MHKISKMMAAIIVKKDGSVCYTIHDAKGTVVAGGGTRRGKNAPKDPIKTACQSVERMLRGLLAQKG